MGSRCCCDDVEWWQAAILAATALAFNWSILPRIGGTRLYRASEVTRGFPLGILLYPLSVLLLILTFRSRLDIVAAAWGILAVGDGMATLVGRAVGGRRVRGTNRRTRRQCGAVAGGWRCRRVSGVVVSSGDRPQPSLWFSIGAPFAAALVAAAVESIPDPSWTTTSRSR